MDISVIVPYHGERTYLKDCLDSLREQSFKDFEVILVGSGYDIPEDVVDIYRADITMKCCRCEKDGVAAARNTGMSVAEGTYVTFVDCDDYLDVRCLQRLHELCVADCCDLMFGKIENTWYKRSIYLDNVESAPDESGESSSDEENGKDEEQGRQFLFYIESGDSEEIIRQKRVEAANRYLILRRKSLQNITVLGILFKREFLVENNITFDETLRYYSDWPFICNVLDLAEKCDGDKEAVYLKRTHNDPIHSPSLLQDIGKKDFEYRMEAYEHSIKRISGKSPYTRAYLDNKLIQYFASEVAPEIRKNEDKIWRKKRMPVIREYISGIDSQVIKNSGMYRRRLSSALIANDVKKLCRLSRNKNLYNWALLIIKGPKRLKIIKEFMYRHVYSTKPVMEDVVLFESFFGKSYSDSPKYIFEKLNQMYPGKYRCVWIIDKKTKLPYPAKQIKRFSFAYFKYLARSKYIVFNSRQPKTFIKRKGNVFLQTWHGTPLKKLVFDMEEVVSASPMYKKTFYIQSRSWDYLVAANAFSEEVFKRAFVFDKPMLKFGYPRNDILHADNKEQIAADIRKRLGIPEDKKVILYAPTWRDDEYYESGKYKFDLKLDLKYMKEKLSDEYAVILRTHYFIADNIDVTGLEGFVFNLSKYDDIAELYLISDILITDYSSVFFDYANLKRPMLFFTYDLDKYRDVLRGFYIDMEKELPGPLLFTTEEIVEAILDIRTVNGRYAQIYDEFYERFCGWEDGHASENCIKTVFK